MSNRREFITLLGGAAAWPLAARAQRPERMRRIGLLMGAADNREGQARVTALKQGLQELGWTDGGNIQIETRFAGAGRPHTGSRSRTSSARARRNRRPNDAGHSGAAAGNKLHSDRNRGSQRSCRARLRFELGASGRDLSTARDQSLFLAHRHPQAKVLSENPTTQGPTGHWSARILERVEEVALRPAFSPLTNSIGNPLASGL